MAALAQVGHQVVLWLGILLALLLSLAGVALSLLSISGTWLVSWSFGEDLSGQAITTLTADGQFMSSNTHQFVVVADATTEERGTWIQTGARSLRTTSLKLCSSLNARTAPAVAARATLPTQAAQSSSPIIC